MFKRIRVRVHIYKRSAVQVNTPGGPIGVI